MIRGAFENAPLASILLVDDHAPNLVALKAVLAPLGHELVCVTSGKDALRAVLERELALIVLDVQMPGMDGFETAAQIKARQASRHIPIIFLTAYSIDAAQVFRGYQEGAVDYMLKPFDPDILRSKVHVFVELWQRGEKVKQREERLRELERERLQREADRRCRALLEAMPQCVLAMQADGSLWYCNEVWQRYSGLDEQKTRSALWDVIHEEERQQVHNAWNEARRQRQPFWHELRLRRARDGAFRWHLVEVLPQFDGGENALSGWIATATDIHEEKTAREELEQASRAKDEFLATISHELRNPLNAIVGWTRMLREGRLDPQRAERALATIERNAAMQAALVEDMLDVSRIITGKLVLSVGTVDVRAIILAAIDTVRMAAEAKSIEVRLDLANDIESASGDPERLQQVVWNLLSNAIKFTPPGGWVEVKTERHGSEVELTVRDTGPGIPPDFLPYVFDRFRQADSTSTRMHGGLGLGLAIVRHLVELHGGTVRVTSRPEERGATFTVRLPLRVTRPLAIVPTREADAERGRAHRPLGDKAELAGLSFLVVDDEPDARELLTALLEHHGAVVVTAGSVEDALPLLQQVRPNALVSDIGMPGADGYELIRRVRSLPDEQGGATPATALTGYARPEDGRRALDAGFSAHLAKPVDPAALVEMLQRLARGGAATETGGEARRPLSAP